MGGFSVYGFSRFMTGYFAGVMSPSWFDGRDLPVCTASRHRTGT